MVNPHIPYVYLIKHKPTGLKYLGVRYAKGCHPNDLWTTYFTSSNLVACLLEEFGPDSFIVRVIHRYPDRPDLAVLREAAYFPLIKEREEYLNITYSSGCQDLRVASKGGRVGGAIVWKRQIGIFRNGGAERKKWAKMGGKASWNKKSNPSFQYWASPEGRRNRASMGGKNGAFSLAFIQRQHGCDEDAAKLIHKQNQSSRGKRGGKKNKGFVWYNDGACDFKYTLHEQKKQDFDTFVGKNGFNRGRVKRTLVCDVCYKEGTSLPAMKRHHFDRCKYRNENHKNSSEQATTSHL